ncbi:hypothetical protein AC78_1252 [Escherichia coli 7-233-03_S4_C1]|nr:hypothetical protein AC78_1252 [Escherichia coli 7-233-03_S4_C1]
MSNAQEAEKPRHKETSLIFPVLALVVLFDPTHVIWTQA